MLTFLVVGPSRSDTVPVSGWQYADGTGTWPHDSGIRVTTV